MKVPPSSIFICYRRSDTAHICGRIYDRVVAEFGRAAVFRDVDAIPPGVDFPAFIQARFATAQVGLVLIGSSWLTVQDAAGEPRLHNPADHVRIEIESMLAHADLTVVPVFAGEVTEIRPALLPESLRRLAFLNGVPMRADPDFEHDIERLLRFLHKEFERRKPTLRPGQAWAATLKFLRGNPAPSPAPAAVKQEPVKPNAPPAPAIASEVTEPAVVPRVKQPPVTRSGQGVSIGSILVLLWIGWALASKYGLIPAELKQRLHLGASPTPAPWLETPGGVLSDRLFHPTPKIDFTDPHWLMGGTPTSRPFSGLTPSATPDITSNYLSKDMALRARSLRELPIAPSHSTILSPQIAKPTGATPARTTGRTNLGDLSTDVETWIPSVMIEILPNGAVSWDKRTMPLANLDKVTLEATDRSLKTLQEWLRSVVTIRNLAIAPVPLRVDVQPAAETSEARLKDVRDAAEAAGMTNLRVLPPKAASPP
jgi:hypothetical protein